jgi:hypothetical protein
VWVDTPGHGVPVQNHCRPLISGTRSRDAGQDSAPLPAVGDAESACHMVRADAVSTTWLR